MCDVEIERQQKISEEIIRIILKQGRKYTTDREGGAIRNQCPVTSFSRNNFTADDLDRYNSSAAQEQIKKANIIE
jgi:hypothetical protein